MKKILAMICVATGLCACGEKETMNSPKMVEPLISEDVRAVVDSLYERMNKEERCAQLYSMYLSELLDEKGHLDTAKCRKMIPNGVGHFAQYASNFRPDATPDSIRDLVAEVQKWLKENTPSGVPALFHEEVLSGVAAPYSTTYPEQIGIACSFNPELVVEKTKQTAKSVRKIGGLLCLSPMVDVSRNPMFNRNEESYGEDGYLSAVLGTAFVEGLQYDGLEHGVAACSKHFLGYGSGSVCGEKELMEEILLPHETMTRVGGSKVVMTGYQDFHGVRAVANTELQQDILRKYLQYDGLMVSDYGSIDQVPMKKGEDSRAERASLAFNAGNDIEFQTPNNYPYLLEAMEKGLVSDSTFEAAVKRVLALKARLGMLKKDAKLYAEGHIELDTKAERETAYKLATQSVVMLKNNGVLPIKGKKIALVGPNANSMQALCGDYSYQGMAYFWHFWDIVPENPKFVVLKEGMETKLPKDCSMEYSRGIDWTEETETVIEDGGDERAAWMRSLLDRRVKSDEETDRNKAVELAKQSDVVVAAMGENILLCGENRDRKSGIKLPGKQKEFVEALIATGKPVVLVMFGGRAQVIGDLAERCAAVIQAWYPGEEGGNALADILYGNVSPSGKLSVSYPKEEFNENYCYNNSTEDDRRIQYPFGYGLSYCEFEYSNMKVSDRVKTTDDVVSISFSVTNKGDMKADEVAQLYLSAKDGNHKAIQLVGFKRVSLAPNETKRVELSLPVEQLGYYKDKGWTIASGEFELKVGASCRDIRLNKTIKLEGNDVRKPLRERYFCK